jgi:CheY-like chemotaxis protein
MRILIADGDSVRAKRLAEACVGQGHTVERVVHGATALELALERLPDVVACPIDLPVIDGVRLAEILRSNPRTRGASFIFLVKDDMDAPISMDPRDVTVGDPWHSEQVLDHINAALERSARFGGVRTDAEMEGKLSQIALVDLLQLFHMNRKTGVMRINREGASGAASIVIRAGQVVDASIPLEDGETVVGEKALFRMLAWKEGRFEFLPGPAPEAGRIRRPMRALLLEGMRQVDEAEQHRESLPSEDACLSLRLSRDKIPANLHPLTREVIDAMETHQRVSDILDHCSFPDYQVLRVLADLLRRGGAEVETPTSPTSPATGRAEDGLFTPTQIRRLREWAASLGLQTTPVVKVLVVAADLTMIRGFFEALRECPDFRPTSRLVREPASLGGAATLGHFHLGEGLSVRVNGISADPFYSPLWEVAAHGILGAVILPSGPYGAALEATEEAFGRLREPPSRTVLHLLMADDPSTALSEETREGLSALQGGTVFVLPAAPSAERLPVLRNVFARLVP